MTVESLQPAFLLLDGFHGSRPSSSFSGKSVFKCTIVKYGE